VQTQNCKEKGKIQGLKLCGFCILELVKFLLYTLKVVDLFEYYSLRRDLRR